MLSTASLILCIVARLAGSDLFSPVNRAASFVNTLSVARMLTGMCLISTGEIVQIYFNS
jgi:hypothetical protein